MRRDRFFVKKPLGEETFTDDVRLVHQIKHVLRLKELDEIILFNESESVDFVYQIKEIGKNSLILSLKEKVLKDNFCAKTVLCLSPIRKELFEYSCLKATELGVTDIIPTICDHTDKQFLRRDRLEAIVMEASEQSGRTDLPVIHDAVPLSKLSYFLESLLIPREGRYALNLKGEDPRSYISKHKKNTPLSFLVGPEGGFSPAEEKTILLEDFVSLHLKTPILRAETAAITCIYLASLLRD